MQKKYILALDSGTTSNRAILFDKSAAIVSMSQQEFTQIYPRPGWVEHDAEEIWKTQYAVITKALQQKNIHPAEIAAIGITNQRETVVVWDKNTSAPLCKAIVWQDRRTASICDNLKSRGLESYIKKTTGLVIDSYFSGTKIQYILDNVEGARTLAEQGSLAFGTVDSWLVWKLTGGKHHLTDYSNASRTMLYNIQDLCWDSNLLDELGVPRALLPEVRQSSEIYGYCNPELFDGESIPIAGIAGDQQAALFGQACFFPGTTKSTYGTGCFILMHTGEKAVASQNNLLTTIAWGINKKVEYALEGSVFAGGSVVQWLRDELNLIKTTGETEKLAAAVADTGGVYLVPAFTGLGAPYWDMYARGTITGLTRGTNKKHIIRAALESICYQCRDVMECMKHDSGIVVDTLKVDGGACMNNFLMQFQSDIMNVPVSRPHIVETTSLGAAFLAGLATEFWKTQNEIPSAVDAEFSPAMTENTRKQLCAGWEKAVKRAKGWAEKE